MEDNSSGSEPATVWSRQGSQTRQLEEGAAVVGKSCQYGPTGEPAIRHVDGGGKRKHRCQEYNNAGGHGSSGALTWI